MEALKNEESLGLVSVVVPTYNYGRYLPEAVESVLRQTYKNYEVIIINDGSTDGTEQIIEPYLLHPQVRYFRQENAGQARAKNRGILESRGELIAFLDADDLWAPDKLALQIRFFDNPEVAVVYSGFKQIDENGMITQAYIPFEKCRGLITEKLLYSNFVCFSSAVVRRKTLETAGIFDEALEMAIDWDLWLRLSVKFPFDFVDEDLVLYRVGHPQQMSKNAEKRFACGAAIKKKFFQGNPAYAHLERDVNANTFVRIAIYYLGKDTKISDYNLLKAIQSNPLAFKYFMRFYRESLKITVKRMLKMTDDGRIS